MSSFEKPKKVLILGSGGLRIGQAGEFDYSGSQAIKALKEEGIRTVLVNPNIATVQTDANMADELYLEPLTIGTVSRIIEKERPDGLLLGFGGQTALNLGLALKDAGVLLKYGVRVLGTQVSAIRKTEDRELFKQELNAIDVHTPKSISVGSVADARSAARKIGYPVMLRAGFSLGGQGSGIIRSEEDLDIRAQEALSGAPQILIEEYLHGWKEIEYEIVRDRDDNALTVCNMENMDPMGIHTGESIVVAPSQTLTNAEYHCLREVALKTARHIGIVGECNIQYALNPKNGDYRVIEMNARLSRSSALASKATGYPLAYVAAKLALGYRLHEIKNSVTKKTTAFFEPALDYLVVKIPRWDTNKLRNADRRIGSEMKSVGEVMAIGRSFPEALQKAVRMLGIGAQGLSDYPYPLQNVSDEIEFATDRRLFALYHFFLKGGSVDEAASLSCIDRWFLHHICDIAREERDTGRGMPKRAHLQRLKKFGFSDTAIGLLCGVSSARIRASRMRYGIRPVIKQIDTLSGEFPAVTNYLYCTYHGQENDVAPSRARPYIILGSGPYAIGSSVEFDWCAVNAVRTLRALKKHTIIINSNPETVSTDYDESERLYFEELSLERVRDIADFEHPKALVVSVGGQAANTLALPLAQAGYPIAGTSPENIDRAENREKFSSLLSRLGIDQPEWERVVSPAQAGAFGARVGYPVLVRPSYVLSGAAMNVAYAGSELDEYLREAALVSPEHPTVLSRFIEGAKECEIDGVADSGRIVIEAVTEHVENAGVHSGDATVVMPPQRLYLETMRRVKDIAKKIVKELQVSGPFNIQFIAKDNRVRVIECNLRASRSFPFVSKVSGYNFIDIAARVLAGARYDKEYETLELPYVGVKTPQFSYNRLKGANPVAHVEMASTGEVACINENYLTAFLSSWCAADQSLKSKRVLVSLSDAAKSELLGAFITLDGMGWKLFATEGTHDFFALHGIASSVVFRHDESRLPKAEAVIAERSVALVVNIPAGAAVYESASHGYAMRRAAIDYHVPLITNLHIAKLFLSAVAEYDIDNLPVHSWKEYSTHSV